MSSSSESRMLWRILPPLIVAEITSAFEVAMIFACLPTLHRHFADPIGVGWVLTACFLVSAIGAALCGRLGDLFGRRKLLIIILLLCAIGSTISAFSTDLSGVVVGASIQGLSGAMLPLAFGLARVWLPAKKVPFGVGVIGAALALGSGLGLLVGGAIVDRFDWNAIFYTSATMALVGAAVVFLFIPKDPDQAPPREGIDMLTGILFAPAIGGILFAVGKARDWGWGDNRIHGLLAASLVLLAFWVWHQWNQKNPLINVRFFAVRKIALAYFAMAMVALGTMQIAIIMSHFLQQPLWTGTGFGLTATMAGLVLLPTHWIGVIASPASGMIAEKYGARAAGLIGATMLTSGWLLILLHHSSLWFVAGAVLWLHIGFMIIYAAIPNLVIEAVPQESTSEATGVGVVFRALFMAVGSQMVTLIMSSSTVSDPAGGKAAYPTEAGFMMAFVYVAVTSLLCLLSFLMISRRRTAQPQPVPATS